jgi:predicted phage gp36 major capsid-like protein
MEFYVTPAATLKLLNEATVDLDDWITKEVSEAVALQGGEISDLLTA